MGGGALNFSLQGLKDEGVNSLRGLISAHVSLPLALASSLLPLLPPASRASEVFSLAQRRWTYVWFRHWRRFFWKPVRYPLGVSDPPNLWRFRARGYGIFTMRCELVLTRTLLDQLKP